MSRPKTIIHFFHVDMMDYIVNLTDENVVNGFPQWHVAASAYRRINRNNTF